MIIQSSKVYYEEKLQPLQLKIENGKIVDIYPYKQFKADKDYKDYIVMPGLVDVHNHGYNLGDNNHATEKWLKEWTSYLPSEGVTATLSTISSNPKDTLLKALKKTAKTKLKELGEKAEELFDKIEDTVEEKAKKAKKTVKEVKVQEQH